VRPTKRGPLCRSYQRQSQPDVPDDSAGDTSPTSDEVSPELLSSQLESIVASNAVNIARSAAGATRTVRYRGSARGIESVPQELANNGVTAAEVVSDTGSKAPSEGRKIRRRSHRHADY